MKIKVIRDSNLSNCNCGNWLAHWNNFNAKPAVFCLEIRCTQMARLQGAIVKKSDTNNGELFVVPLCEKHALSNDELTLVNNANLETTDVTKTCDKK